MLELAHRFSPYQPCEAGGWQPVPLEKGELRDFRSQDPGPDEAAKVIAPEGRFVKLPAGTNRQVLLVDDDDLVLIAMGALLCHLGQEPIAVGSGEEALAALAGGLEPGLVILDLDMPGLGGAETLARIRALRPDLPVLISSGCGNLADACLATRYPMVGLLPKPVCLQDLVKVLD